MRRRARRFAAWCKQASPARQLARRLLGELGERRGRLVRLALRRRDVHVSLALALPDPAGEAPAEFHQLVRGLAQRVTCSVAPA